MKIYYFNNRGGFSCWDTQNEKVISSKFIYQLYKEILLTRSTEPLWNDSKENRYLTRYIENYEWDRP